MNKIDIEKFKTFLNGKETHLQISPYDQDISAFVMVPFDEVPIFVNDFGFNVFSDGHIGIDVSLFKQGLMIELNSLLQLNGVSLKEFKAYFNSSDWNAIIKST